MCSSFYENWFLEQIEHAIYEYSTWKWRTWPKTIGSDKFGPNTDIYRSLLLIPTFSMNGFTLHILFHSHHHSIHSICGNTLYHSFHRSPEKTCPAELIMHQEVVFKPMQQQLSWLIRKNRITIVIINSELKHEYKAMLWVIRNLVLDLVLYFIPYM